MREPNVTHVHFLTRIVTPCLRQCSALHA